MIGLIILWIVLFAIAAMFLAPPTFFSDWLDGEKRKKKDWTEEDD